MTWTRVADDFTDRADVVSLPVSARWLHIEGLVWSNRHLTDGRLPARMLRRISDSDSVEEDVKALLDAGLWTAHVDVDGTVYQLDWTDQEPAQVVRQRQEYRAATQRRYRERRSRHASGDHSTCDPRFCPLNRVTGNATDHVTDDESSQKTSTRPVPSRPARDRDEEQGERLPVAADAAPVAARSDRDWRDDIASLEAHHFDKGRDGLCKARLLGLRRGSDGHRSFQTCGQPEDGWHHGHLYAAAEPSESSSARCRHCGNERSHPIHP